MHEVRVVFDLQSSGADLCVTEQIEDQGATTLGDTLGYTAGRPHEPDFQRDLLRRAFSAFEAIDVPGTIVDTGVRWTDDASWKDSASSGLNNGVVSAEGDTRSERNPEPQYQYDDDRLAAEGA